MKRTWRSRAGEWPVRIAILKWKAAPGPEVLAGKPPDITRPARVRPVPQSRLGRPARHAANQPPTWNTKPTATRNSLKSAPAVCSDAFEIPLPKNTRR